MSLYLGVLLFSFIFTSLAIIPFIDLLFYLQFTLAKRQGLKKPVGGGVLTIVIVSFLFIVLFSLISRFGVYIETSYPLKSELNLLFITFITFGVIGLYDDLLAIFGGQVSKKLKTVVHIVAAVSVATMLHKILQIDYLNIPGIGILRLGLGYVPFAAGLILIYTKGFTSSDKVDGFVGGNLLISLAAFWILSYTQLDTPLSLFISLWIGAILALLYFNVYPARIVIGNAGCRAFAATFAVIGLLIGKPIAVLVVGGIFFILGILSLFKIDIFKWLASRGWPESKIMMRSWLIVLLCSAIGIWLS